MELKYVIPNIEKTFGNLEYAGEGKVEQQRINGRMTTHLAAIICILIFNVQMILRWFSHKKQEKNSLNMRKK